MIKRSHVLTLSKIIQFTSFLGFLTINITLPVMGQKSAIKIAESITIEDPNNTGGGQLFARINGKQLKIADFAVIALRAKGGKQIIYTSIVKPFGFSDAPFPVFRYDVATGQTKRIFFKYIHIDALREVTLSDNRSVLIGRTSLETKPYSGNIILDPDHGELLYREHSLLTNINADAIALSDYSTDEETWNSIRELQGETVNDKTKLILSQPLIKPTKLESIDLKTIKPAAKPRH